MIMFIIIIFVVSRRRHQEGGVAEWSMHCTRDQNVVGSNLLEATFSPSLVSAWWAQYQALGFQRIETLSSNSKTVLKSITLCIW